MKACRILVTTLSFIFLSITCGQEYQTDGVLLEGVAEHTNDNFEHKDVHVDVINVEDTPFDLRHTDIEYLKDQMIEPKPNAEPLEDDNREEGLTQDNFNDSLVSTETEEVVSHLDTFEADSEPLEHINIPEVNKETIIVENIIDVRDQQETFINEISQLSQIVHDEVSNDFETVTSVDTVNWVDVDYDDSFVEKRDVVFDDLQNSSIEPTVTVEPIVDADTATSDVYEAAESDEVMEEIQLLSVWFDEIDELEPFEPVVDVVDAVENSEVAPTVDELSEVTEESFPAELAEPSYNHEIQSDAVDVAVDVSVSGSVHLPVEPVEPIEPVVEFIESAEPVAELIEHSHVSIETVHIVETNEFESVSEVTDEDSARDHLVEIDEIRQDPLPAPIVDDIRINELLTKIADLEAEIATLKVTHANTLQDVEEKSLICSDNLTNVTSKLILTEKNLSAIDIKLRLAKNEVTMSRLSIDNCHLTKEMIEMDCKENRTTIEVELSKLRQAHKTLQNSRNSGGSGSNNQECRSEGSVSGQCSWSECAKSLFSFGGSSSSKPEAVVEDKSDQPVRNSLFEAPSPPVASTRPVKAEFDSEDKNTEDTTSQFKNILTQASSSVVNILLTYVIPGVLKLVQLRIKMAKVVWTYVGYGVGGVYSYALQPLYTETIHPAVLSVYNTQVLPLYNIHIAPTITSVSSNVVSWAVVNRWDEYYYVSMEPIVEEIVATFHYVTYFSAKLLYSQDVPGSLIQLLHDTQHKTTQLITYVHAIPVVRSSLGSQANVLFVLATTSIVSVGWVLFVLRRIVLGVLALVALLFLLPLLLILWIIATIWSFVRPNKGSSGSNKKSSSGGSKKKKDGSTSRHDKEPQHMNVDTAFSNNLSSATFSAPTAPTVVMSEGRMNSRPLGSPSHTTTTSSSFVDYPSVGGAEPPRAAATAATSHETSYAYNPPPSSSQYQQMPQFQSPYKLHQQQQQQPPQQQVQHQAPFSPTGPPPSNRNQLPSPFQQQQQSHHRSSSHISSNSSTASLYSAPPPPPTYGNVHTSAEVNTSSPPHIGSGVGVGGYVDTTGGAPPAPLDAAAGPPTGSSMASYMFSDQDLDLA